MANRVNTVNTLGSAVAHITGRLKEYTQKTVPPNLWKEIINTKVDMIHEVLGTKEKAIYKDREILSAPTMTGGMVSGSLSAATYTNATKTVYIPTGIWASYFSNLASASALPIGTIVLLRDDRGGQVLHYSSVLSITDATHFVINDAYGSDMSASAFGIALLVGTTSDDVLLSGQTYYKYIDQILSIYDSGIADECIDAGTISNFWGIKKRNVAYNYKDSIIWVRDGEYLRFAKGSSVTSYGTRTMYFTRKPYPVSVDADYIDLPPSQMDLLYKLCMLDGLQVIQVPIPDELKSAEGQISAMRSAKEEEIAKYLLNKSDN